MAARNYITIVSGHKATDISFDSDNIPSADITAALAGTSGTPPDGSNKLVDNADTRMTDARTPTSHDNTYHSATYITTTGVTYEALSGNSDVGQSSNTVAAGDDNRFPTSDEKAGLAGVSGYAPTAANPVATESYVESRVVGIEWWKSADFGINYINAGEPTGTPVDGEKLWDTTAGTMKIYNTDTWETYSVSVGDRFIFKTDGKGIGGATANDKVYEITETGPIVATNNAPTEGTRIIVNEENSGSGVEYQFNTEWGTVPGVTAHDNLTGIVGDGTSHISVNQAAAISGATTLSASNVVFSEADRDMIPVKYTFVYYNGIAISQTNVELGKDCGIGTREVMPAAGSVVKMTAQLSADVTGGSVVIKPANAGGAFTGTDLDLTVSSAGTPNNVYATTAPDTTNLTFAAGATLSALATTDGNFAPVTASIQVDMYVVFNT